MWFHLIDFNNDAYLNKDLTGMNWWDIINANVLAI